MKKYCLCKRFFFEVVMTISFTGITLCTAAQDCEQLISYRDKQLVAEFNRTFDKYTLHASALDDLEKIKSDLLGGSATSFSAKYLISDGALATSVIAKDIKATCDLILGLISLVPGEELAGNAVEKGSRTAEYIFKALESGETIHSLVTEGAEKTVVQQVLTLGNPLMKSVKIAWKFSEDIAEMAKMSEEQEVLKKEVNRILTQLESQAKIYEQALKSSKLRLNQINALLEGVTKYITKNCPLPVNPAKVPTAQAMPHPVEDRLLKKTDPDGIGKKRFWIFLSAELNIGQKTISAFSHPFEHHGEYSDAMSLEKQLFEQSLRQGFSSIPATTRDSAVTAARDQFMVHFGIPYSRKILVTSEDAERAVQATIEKYRQNLAGLPDSDKVEFYKLP